MTATHRDRTVQPAGAITALAFAAVVLMWLTGYVARMPWISAPGSAVLAAVVTIFIAGGFLAGRLAGAGAARGAVYGIAVSLLNLLVLGGLVMPGEGTGGQAAWLFLPATLAFGAGVGALSAVFGVRHRAARSEIDWTHVLALVALFATFVLILAGGLVTSFDAGLAVPDWPNTFGYAMFLYPLSRMTGGIFYEHAHRLFGSLVGLATIAVCWRAFRTRRGAAAWLAAAAVALVVVQGVLGGLRVTGSFTLSTAETELSPSLLLAVVHGVTGQLFLALITAIATLTSRAYAGERTVDAGPFGRGTRIGSIALAGLLVAQLVLGAVVRHRGEAVMAHIGLAVVVGMAALVVGTVFWGSVREPMRLGWLGIALAWLAGLQFALGFAAFAVRGGGTAERTYAWYEVLLTTSHQLNGATLLALSVAIACWCLRLPTRD